MCGWRRRPVAGGQEPGGDRAAAAASCLPHSNDDEAALKARLTTHGAGKVEIDGATLQLAKTVWDEDGDETEVTASLSGSDVVSKILGELRCRIADFLGADAKEVLCCVLAAPADILNDVVSQKLCWTRPHRPGCASYKSWTKVIASRASPPRTTWRAIRSSWWTS